jgi:alkylation response protein AidB-like acyl-CoA dehydrogenase
MYFGLSEDQIFFQDNVKKFLEDNAPLDVVRNISKGEDPNQKNEIHSGIINLGINNILVPEEYGGLGLDLLFATAISQSIGGAVAPLPYCGSYVMAPIAIQIGASKSQKENIFNEMSSGNTKFGIAFSEYFGSRDSSSINFSNEKINGKTIFAIDCDYATDVLVSDANGKIGIASIEDKNIEIVDLITVDKTRTYKEIKFSNANVEILENTKKNTEAIEKALDAGRIITAADTLGASQAMLDKAVSYSKERKQFNRVIGSFQAVKHMCAEMAADLEPCYSLVWHAAHSFDNNDDDSKIMSCHAKSHISEVAKMVSKKATEVHGGMGFTDLLGLHFWFKRIGLNRQLLGAPEIVRNEAAKAQGL